MNDKTIRLIETRIDRGDSLSVAADLRSAAPGEARPLIIVSHGFLGYRRWGFFPWLSERLAAAGFHVMTISFSRCGVDETAGRITNPDLFASNSVCAEIEDLLAACAAARRADFPLRCAGRKWGLMGHSRGGAVSILAAPLVPETGSIVTWSALSKLDRYTQRRKDEWKRTGRLPFNEGRADTQLWLDYSYYDDIDRNREAYDLPKRASELGVPHLIVHGRRDAAVTLKEARGLIGVPGGDEARWLMVISGDGKGGGLPGHPGDEKARGLTRRHGEESAPGLNGQTLRVEKRFEIIEGCGHTFGVRHPMKRPPAGLERAAGLTVDWFERTLGEKGA